MELTRNELYEMARKPFGDNVSILDVKGNIVLLRYMGDDINEYAVMRYNDRGLYSGHYYSTFATPEREAKDLAKTKFREMV